jgi:hypothetical protein
MPYGHAVASSSPSSPRWHSIACACFSAIVLAWFWKVAAHRVGDAPFSGFAHVFSTGCGDFEHFFHAAQAMRAGQDIYSAGAQGYIYPPLIAFLFMPLTFLSVQTAAQLMLTVNIAMAAGCAWIASAEALQRFGLANERGLLLKVSTLTLLLSATRLRGEIQMWQTDLPMMLLLLLALRQLDARPWLAGLLLGAAVNIKYLPLVYIPYLLARRRHQAAAWAGLGVLVFALLPALGSGWDANAHHWSRALSGMLRLVGLAGSAEAGTSANIDPIAAGYSLSLTSGIARVLGPGFSPLFAMVAAAAAGLVAAVGIARLYRWQEMPLLAWPAPALQRAQPYFAFVMLEWTGLMTFALALSPQTNPRHTSLLLMAFAPMAVILCRPRTAAARVLAVSAVAIALLGLSIPTNLDVLGPAFGAWREIGGAGWCLLLAVPLCLSAGFEQFGRARRLTPA